jgi:hypothetical protein
VTVESDPHAMEEQNVVGSSSVRDRHPSIEHTPEPDDAATAIKGQWYRRSISWGSMTWSASPSSSISAHRRRLAGPDDAPPVAT